MKRSPRTVFDDSGNKWYQSPHFKEMRIEGMENENMFHMKEETLDSSKLLRDKFYDFFNKITRNGEPRLDPEELNKSLNFHIEEIPDSGIISEIFERLNSKVALSNKGKKNWSEEETLFFIWVVINYSFYSNCDFTDLVDDDWRYIASVFPGKKIDQCKIKWQGLLKVNLSKAPWTVKEDGVLMEII
mmetsp:Transcript_16516/g.14275  ORF Transcript_16516/g.14275 Transcript_16516/m.14275 type:complete len:187 (+) Transcript_16516:65-625(+)|eukprot:CAMPEP_0114592542 /NCGR_PEP_ID=MMETSP0125-20121206/14344_1 /TAXON_ID=485358 ORGANISM="Aristerostoma sp., Strain ATCC 50986" /NCGR_SAMPLE_ID=MMETSP0125 /ASSEMBLY_ACC=CAM_ASM_000245 /LENGTH=186 /DNA_ID=CAMNT_0001791241 /DNA_START=40 /DNA_END=600 /DNA_ORIENTATION=-